ncbi:uncharacterized protein K452DRAFT_236099 [Aplosporella prunicola CBS 121167]|uniref:Small ribosomal subunit protein mS35 mitochondrial conserved domain-containing protein n=1 Tax=Aplosporella prunicola CBS 121167 TaxID=1176127 RepID=A0A6A6B178_9PEZI|nr:uncharacterized protein K452DRAFT_236099 [Aplosporella prunicola CBS 121167]KAF2137328.1 hypothetical protein K452DRAFT_236099 [Aplosporella prunicola CBS 121167]
MNEVLRDVDPSELQGYIEPKQLPPRGFWGEGEPEGGEDEEWNGDDIPSLGHGELEQQREIREYMRMAAWELPLLTKYAKPFEPPTAEKPLRFRYTSYMGEQHPAANKVVVEFSVTDIPNLTQVQQDKLIKLAGPRYNPDTQIIKISADNFETQAKNKRYLGDRIADLVSEARNPKDTFADVPFDFRHHKPKIFHHFPKDWVMTPQRKQLLDQRREQRWQLEQKRVEEGTLVDGAEIVKEALSTPIFEQAEPVMIEKGKAPPPRRPTTLGAR